MKKSDKKITYSDALNQLRIKYLGKDWFAYGNYKNYEKNKLLVTTLIEKLTNKNNVETFLKTYPNNFNFSDNKSFYILVDYVIPEIWTELLENDNDDNPEIALKAIYKKYNYKYFIKRWFKMIKTKIFNQDEIIPAKGEQVLLEDGSFVIGDGIHPVKDLPKPKILHD